MSVLRLHRVYGARSTKCEGESSKLRSPLPSLSFTATADSTKSQKSYLSANWPIRGSPAFVILPNAGEVNVIFGEGVGELFCPEPSQPISKLVQFITLKNSALNVNFPLSPRNGNDFTMEKSFWRKPGPIKEFRGTLPNFPGDGRVYAA